MKKIITLAFLCLFTLTTRAQKIYRDSISNVTFKLSIDSTAYMDSSDYEYYVRDITILKEDKIQQVIKIDSAMTQRFPGRYEDFFPEYYENEFLFIIEDVNFDGYRDIRLLSWLGIRLDKEYRYWLYNEQTGLYAEDSTLTEIMNPEFNQQAKMVCESYRPGGPTDFSYRKYVWNRRELLKVEEWELSARPYKSKYRESLCHYEIINGDWEIKEECRWLKKNEVVEIPCKCE